MFPIQEHPLLISHVVAGKIENGDHKIAYGINKETRYNQMKLKNAIMFIFNVNRSICKDPKNQPSCLRKVVPEWRRMSALYLLEN